MAPAAGAQEVAPTIGRDYALDAARAILMMMGVVLHAATAYSKNGEWVVLDPQNSVGFDWLVQGVHLFRMPGFFWISGYFFALTMSRGSPRTVLRRRFVRLIVPLVATWLTFNVVQEWITAVAFHKDPVEVIRAGVPVYHLWFLVDLVVFSAVGAAAMLLPRTPLIRAGGALPGRPTVVGVLLGLTLVSSLTFLAARASGIAYVPIFHVTGVGRLATYLPFFGVGAAMYHLPAIRRVFLQVPPVLVLVALPVGVYAQSFRREQGVFAEIAAPTEGLMIWICIAVVLQFFYRVVRAENRVVRLLNDSSYSIYLFHHAIMVAAVLLLLPHSLGALPKFVLVLVVTFSLAAALHLLLVEHSPVLRLLFNGKWVPRAAEPGTLAMVGQAHPQLPGEK